MKPCRRPSSPRRSTSDSHRAAKPTTRTSCFPPCAFSSAATWRKRPRKRPLEGTITMTGSHSDALVFFGATGDLAYKKIFPALQAMSKHGNLNIPIVGVAKAGWNVDQLRARARESVEKHGGGVDAEAFPRLVAQLR